MNIEIKDVSRLIDKSYLAECVADRIMEDNTNHNYEEFDGELLEGIRKAVKRIVDEYMEDYLGESDVHDLVRKVLKDMTRSEIIDALKN